MIDLQYRTAFALALRPTAPSLSALHASYIRRYSHTHAVNDDEPITRLTCIRCGYAPVRTRSRRHKNRTRILERSCYACAFVESTPLVGNTAAEFKSVWGSASTLPPSFPTARTLEPTSTPISPPPPTTTPKRPKKKSGLQELLARNRQRQAQQQAPSTGLSSFLQTL